MTTGRINQVTTIREISHRIHKSTPSPKHKERAHMLFRFTIISHRSSVDKSTLESTNRPQTISEYERRVETPRKSSLLWPLLDSPFLNSPRLTQNTTTGTSIAPAPGIKPESQGSLVPSLPQLSLRRGVPGSLSIP